MNSSKSSILLQNCSSFQISFAVAIVSFPSAISLMCPYGESEQFSKSMTCLKASISHCRSITTSSSDLRLSRSNVRRKPDVCMNFMNIFGLGKPGPANSKISAYFKTGNPCDLSCCKIRSISIQCGGTSVFHSDCFGANLLILTHRSWKSSSALVRSLNNMWQTYCWSSSFFTMALMSWRILLCSSSLLDCNKVDYEVQWELSQSQEH